MEEWSIGKLLSKLDERYALARERKDNSKPLKLRKAGPFSQRLPPANAPQWAISTGDSVDSSGPASSASETVDDLSDDPARSSEDLSFVDDSQASGAPSPTPPVDENGDPEMDAWISDVTGVHLS